MVATVRARNVGVGRGSEGQDKRNVEKEGKINLCHLAATFCSIVEEAEQGAWLTLKERLYAGDGRGQAKFSTMSTATAQLSFPNLFKLQRYQNVINVCQEEILQRPGY